MSLPRYVINFEELVKEIKPKETVIEDFFGEDDGNVLMQRVKGFLATNEEPLIRWQPKKNIAVSSIEYGSSKNQVCKNISFNLSVEEKSGKIVEVFENIYIKNVVEFKSMVNKLIIGEGDTLLIKCNSIVEDMEFEVAFDINYAEQIVY